MEGEQILIDLPLDVLLNFTVSQDLRAFKDVLVLYLLLAVTLAL